MTSSENNSEWAELLPEKCPPADARPPQGEVYYRLVKSNPPQKEDFWSFRKLNPRKHFCEDECIVRALSIYITFKSCNDIKKLPTHKDRDEKIIKITLSPESGVVKKTRGSNHFSWWRKKEFDPIPHCEFV